MLFHRWLLDREPFNLEMGVLLGQVRISLFSCKETLNKLSFRQLQIALACPLDIPIWGNAHSHSFHRDGFAYSIVHLRMALRGTVLSVGGVRLRVLHNG